MQPLITFRNVNHFYADGPLCRQILYDVSAEVHSGEIVLLTGPSGSGKTTLLTLAGSLRKVQSGSVLTMGQELNGASRAAMVEVRRQIGFIFHAHNLLEVLTAGPECADVVGNRGRNRAPGNA
jgi:putative ABC transport system ATP-binding protein